MLLHRPLQGNLPRQKNYFQWLWHFFGRGLPHLATFLSSSDFQYTQKTTRYFARDWNNKQAWILVPFYDPAPATTTFSVAAL